MKAFSARLTAFMLAAALVLSATGFPSLAQRPPTPVQVSQVVSMNMAPQVELIGTAQPKLTSVVASEISGLVAQFNVSEGESVAKGEILARLEDSLLQIELSGARARKAETEAHLKKARADLRRSSELLAKKTIAEKQYTDDLAQVEALESKVQGLEADIRHLQESIAKKTIRAPFTGFVVKEHTQVGEWVIQGGAIVTLANLGTVEVIVDVPERYVPRLRLGARVRVRVDALNPGSFSGKITAIIPVGDAAGRTFPVKVAIDNPEVRIKGGMLCRAGLPVGEPRSVLAVPKDAVVNMGERHLLFTVRDGAAQPVPVTLGDASGSMIEVKGEIEPGTRIVVRGNERLQPGQPLQIIQ